MNIAVACGLIILVLLVIMLLAGVPIAVALAVSSICAILPDCWIRAQRSAYRGTERYFPGISVFSLLAIPFFILAGNIMRTRAGLPSASLILQKLFTGISQAPWHIPMQLPTCSLALSPVPVRRQLLPWVPSLGPLRGGKEGMTGISLRQPILPRLPPAF